MAHTRPRTAIPAETSAENARNTTPTGYDPAPTDSTAPATTPAKDTTGPRPEPELTRTVVGGTISGATRSVTDWIIDLIRNS